MRARREGRDIRPRCILSGGQKGSAKSSRHGRDRLASPQRRRGWVVAALAGTLLIALLAARGPVGAGVGSFAWASAWG